MNLETLEEMDFYNKIKVGEIYHNRASSCVNSLKTTFVRCEVVEVNGQKRMKPIALIGEWSANDLPYRTKTGEIIWEYYPARILDKPYGSFKTGDDPTFRPRMNSLYEVNPGREENDPRNEPENWLIPAPLSPFGELKAARWRKIEAIEKVIRNSIADYDDNPLEILKAIHSIVGNQWTPTNKIQLGDWSVHPIVDEDEHLSVYISNKKCDDIIPVEADIGDENEWAERFTTKKIEEKHYE